MKKKFYTTRILMCLVLLFGYDNLLSQPYTPETILPSVCDTSGFGDLLHGSFCNIKMSWYRMEAERDNIRAELERFLSSHPNSSYEIFWASVLMLNTGVDAHSVGVVLKAMDIQVLYSESSLDINEFIRTSKRKSHCYRNSAVQAVNKTDGDLKERMKDIILDHGFLNKAILSDCQLEGVVYLFGGYEDFEYFIKSNSPLEPPTSNGRMYIRDSNLYRMKTLLNNGFN